MSGLRGPRGAAIAAPLLCVALLAGPAATGPAHENAVPQPISAVMDNPKLRAQLPEGVTYYFGDQPAKVVKVLGPLHSNRRTSNLKGPHVACPWAMLGSLISLGEAAKAQGGNAVVGIQSNIGQVPHASTVTYDCLLSNSKMLVNVAFVAEAAIVE
jgi:hypothetical protein